MAKKPQPRNIIAHAGTYPWDVMVSLGETDSQLINQLGKRNYTPTEQERGWIEEHDSTGKFMVFSNGAMLVRVLEFDDTANYYAVLQHELLHAVIHLLRLVGFKLSEDSEEAYTYLLQHLTKQVYTELWR